MTAITFYGGAGSVTGSKYLLEHADKKILVDCGLFQGPKELRELNWQDLPFSPSELSAVVLTHAHIDHSGYLPRLVKLGYQGRIITTGASADLLGVLLPDAARLQEEEADYRNRHQLTSHDPALPLYTESDARQALRLVERVHNDSNAVDICDGVTARFVHAGHILGSSCVLFQMDDGPSVLFSGDLGQYDSPILPDPAVPLACDYLICESTYGNRIHSNLDAKAHLARVINEAVERNGPILIPAFAVGRTQEILYTLRELEDESQIPVLPVIVDSPMAAEATQIYNRWAEEHDEAYAAVLANRRHPLRTASMSTARSRDESKELNKMTGSRIIISASGMLSGGRVLHHAIRILPDPNATLILVGFQAEGTRGRQILEGAASVKIMKVPVPVKCHVELVEGFSAHADSVTILKWLKGLDQAPKLVFITHGEADAADALAEKIGSTLGWAAKVPVLGERVELS